MVEGGDSKNALTPKRVILKSSCPFAKAIVKKFAATIPFFPQVRLNEMKGGVFKLRGKSLRLSAHVASPLSEPTKLHLSQKDLASKLKG